MNRFQREKSKRIKLIQRKSSLSWRECKWIVKSRALFEAWKIMG